MAQFASDDFTGTTGDDLATYSANWANHTSQGSSRFVISANDRAMVSLVSGDACVYHTGTPAGADYTVSAVYHYESGSGSSNIGVLGRVNTAATTYYMARYDSTAAGWQLYRRVAGSFTQIGSTSAQSFTSGSKAILLSMDGNLIEIYKEGSGTPTISQTDGSPITAAGKAGLRGTISSIIHLDSFSADDIGATAPTVAALTPTTIGATTHRPRFTYTA